MTQEQVGAVVQAPSGGSGSRGGAAVAILSFVVAVLSLALIAAMLGAAYLWGELRAAQEAQEQMEAYGGSMLGMPSPEEEEMYMATESVAMDVGYMIRENDSQEYLALYDSADPHVDLAEIEADFEKTVAAAADAEGGVEFMSDMMPIVYEDQTSGETIVKISVSGMDYRTGMPGAGRLTMYCLYQNGEVLGLTGRDGRDMKVQSTGW